MGFLRFVCKKLKKPLCLYFLCGRVPGRGSGAVVFFRCLFEKTRGIPINKLKTPHGEKGRERGEGRDPSVSQSLSTCGCVSKNVFRFSLRFLWVFSKNLENNKVSSGFFLKKTQRNLGVFSFLGDGWPDVSL